MRHDARDVVRRTARWSNCRRARDTLPLPGGGPAVGAPGSAAGSAARRRSVTIQPKASPSDSRMAGDLQTLTPVERIAYRRSLTELGEDSPRQADVRGHLGQPRRREHEQHVLPPAQGDRGCADRRTRWCGCGRHLRASFGGGVQREHRRGAVGRRACARQAGVARDGESARYGDPVSAVGARRLLPRARRPGRCRNGGETRG